MAVFIRRIKFFLWVKNMFHYKQLFWDKVYILKDIYLIMPFSVVIINITM